MKNDFPVYPDVKRSRSGSAEVRLGRAVRALREARGWSQQQLATQLERVNVQLRPERGPKKYTQSMIAKTETADRPITLDEAVSLSIIFGNSLEVMLVGDETPELAEAITRNEQLYTELTEQIADLRRQREEVATELTYLRSAAQLAAQNTRHIDDLDAHERAVDAWEAKVNPGAFIDTSEEGDDGEHREEA